MWHGSANLHANAENRGSHRHAVFQVRRSGFHQTEWKHKNSCRNDRSLHGKVFSGNHPAQVGSALAWLSIRRFLNSNGFRSRRSCAEGQDRRRLLTNAPCGTIRPQPFLADGNTALSVLKCLVGFPTIGGWLAFVANKEHGSAKRRSVSLSSTH
jgi:hypothetical protein